MTPTAADLERAVENCSRDPIHIPGCIQAFGAMLVGDAGFDTIEGASANFADYQNVAPKDLIGLPTRQVFGSEFVHAVTNLLSYPTIEAQREFVPETVSPWPETQVSVHRRGGWTIIEIIPSNTGQADRTLPLQQSQHVLNTPLDPADMAPFLQDVVYRLRAILQMDRVKFYRFLPDGSGEVIAEARHPEMASFLGLHFPATDIPAIARQLYARTPVRVISEVTEADIEMIGRPDAEPVDMSLAVLRGKDMVHQQYLVNMGVAATLTIPVVIDGALWGLFACHHRAPLTPDHTKLATAEFAGKLVSLRVQNALEQNRRDYLLASNSLVGKLIVPDETQGTNAASWDAVKAPLLELLNADGVVFWHDAELHSFGEVPSRAAIRDLIRSAHGDDSEIAFSAELRARYPDIDFGESCGMLLVAPKAHENTRLIYFRGLAERHVSWAGNPEKEVDWANDGPRLNPRNSFDTYLEQIKDRSADWTLVNLEVAGSLRDALNLALTARFDIRESRRMGLKIRELNHRVRNILTLVQSLAQHSRSGASTVEDYADAFEKRMQALAESHTILTRSENEGVPLRDLIEVIAQPFADSDNHAELSGPNVQLRPDAVSVLSLLFHELTSNAVKYGAFSKPGGHVSVSWHREDNGLSFVWKEAGGPPVSPPDETGFGLSVVQKAIPYEVKGKAEVFFDPSGLRAVFWLPDNALTDADFLLPDDAPPMAKPVSQPAAIALSRQMRGLVVEDSYFAAQQARDFLLEEGFAEVDMAGTMDEARAYLERQAYDFCLLDVNLHGEVCTPIALQLREIGVPFAFATGYGREAGEIARVVDASIVTKPIDRNMLRAVLAAELKRD